MNARLPALNVTEAVVFACEITGKPASPATASAESTARRATDRPSELLLEFIARAPSMVGAGSRAISPRVRPLALRRRLTPALPLTALFHAMESATSELDSTPRPDLNECSSLPPRRERTSRPNETSRVATGRLLRLRAAALCALGTLDALMDVPIDEALASLPPDHAHATRSPGSQPSRVGVPRHRRADGPGGADDPRDPRHDELHDRLLLPAGEVICTSPAASQHRSGRWISSRGPNRPA